MQNYIKSFDLEDRTYQFTKKCRDFVKHLPKNQANYEYGKQLIKSSSSTAGNYIEANERLSKKDFLFRIKITRKEVKESHLWLRICETENNPELIEEQTRLIQEANELTKIFSSIINKNKSKE